MKKYTAIIYVIAVMLVAMVSCSTDGKSGGNVCSTDEAYRLGQLHASRLMECESDEALQDSLLEIRSRIYHLEVTAGEKQSREYERGFVEYIKIHDDSLANLLF